MSRRYPKNFYFVVNDRLGNITHISNPNTLSNIGKRFNIKNIHNKLLKSERKNERLYFDDDEKNIQTTIFRSRDPQIEIVLGDRIRANYRLRDGELNLNIPDQLFHSIFRKSPLRRTNRKTGLFNDIFSMINIYDPRNEELLTDRLLNIKNEYPNYRKILTVNEFINIINEFLNDNINNIRDARYVLLKLHLLVQTEATEYYRSLLSDEEKEKYIGDDQFIIIKITDKIYDGENLNLEILDNKIKGIDASKTNTQYYNVIGSDITIPQDPLKGIVIDTSKYNVTFGFFAEASEPEYVIPAGLTFDTLQDAHNSYNEAISLLLKNGYKEFKLIDIHNGGDFKDGHPKKIKKRNDCLLSTLKTIAGLRQSYKKIRELCNLEKGNKKINILDNDKMINLCEKLKINFKILMPVNDEINLLFSGIKKYPICGVLFYYNEHIYVLHKHKIDLKLPDKNKILHVYFDLETVSDFEIFELKPLTISYSIHETNDKLHIECKLNDLKKNLRYFEGKHCIKSFLTRIFEIHKEYRKVCVFSFNGARFDNWLVFHEASRFYPEEMNDIFTYDKNLFFKLSDNIKFFDCIKYCSPSSLDKLTKNNKFYKKVKLNKMSNITFNELNYVYNQNNQSLDSVFDYLKLKNQYEIFIEYNKIDILAMAEWFLYLQEDYMKIMNVYDITSNLTLGSHCLKYFIHKLKLKNPTRNHHFKLTKKEYDLILKSQYAGISYCNRQLTEELITVIDIVSQYPYSLLYGNYPSIDSENKLILTSAFDMDKDLGYHIINNLDQSNLILNIIPGRTKDGYDYHQKIIDEVVINTIDLKQLIKYGVKYDLIESFKWKYTEKGIDIFGDYILPLMKMKNQQDIYKKNKDPRYDPQKRAFIKMMLNIITGKLSQKIQINKEILVNSISLISKYKNDKDYELMGTIAHNVLHFNKIEKTSNKKNIYSYIPIATLIYSYARKLIMDVILENNITPLNIETDSIAMLDNDFKKLQEKKIKVYDDFGNIKNVNLLYKDEGYKYFGQFEIENVFYRGITLSKKTYFFENKDPKYNKSKFKGISKDWIICDDKKLIADYIKCKNKKDYEMYMRLCDKLIKYDPLINNSIYRFEIYKKLFNNEDVYVIYNNILKSFKTNDNKSDAILVPSLGIKKL